MSRHSRELAVAGVAALDGSLRGSLGPWQRLLLLGSCRCDPTDGSSGWNRQGRSNGWQCFTESRVHVMVVYCQATTCPFWGRFEVPSGCSLRLPAHLRPSSRQKIPEGSSKGNYESWHWTPPAVKVLTAPIVCLLFIAGLCVGGSGQKWCLSAIVYPRT